MGEYHGNMEMAIYVFKEKGLVHSQFPHRPREEASLPCWYLDLTLAFCKHEKIPCCFNPPSFQYFFDLWPSANEFVSIA